LFFVRSTNFGITTRINSKQDSLLSLSLEEQKLLSISLHSMKYLFGRTYNFRCPICVPYSIVKVGEGQEEEGKLA
jgi:hypothetical protein